MSLLIENIGLVHHSKDVDEESIVWFLVEITFFRAVIFIQHLIHSIKQLSDELMLVDSFTA